MTRAATFAFLIGALALVDVAHAEGAADELLAAEAAEARGEPGDALERYRRLLAEHPSDRLGRRAEARIAWLEAHGEGGFTPLVELTRLQRADWSKVDDDRLRAFAAKVATFPAGRVRRAAWHLLGDRWLDRGRAAEALAAYRAWLAEPDLDEAERQLAASGEALALGRLGSGGEALERLADAGLHGRAEARYLRAERLGRGLEVAALAVLVGYAGLLVMAMRRTRSGLHLRPTIGRAELSLAAFALALPVAFVRRYDPQLVRTFWPSMAAAAVVLGVSWLGAGALEPSHRERQRLAWASGLAVLAASLVAARHSGMLTELLVAAWEPLG